MNLALYKIHLNVKCNIVNTFETSDTIVSGKRFQHGRDIAMHVVMREHFFQIFLLSVALSGSRMTD